MGEEAVFGHPPSELAAPAADAVQVSPLAAGAASLEAFAAGALARVTMAAPAGAIERRYALALALRSLRPEGELVAMARKDRGGLRLRRELESLGCEVMETAKQHFRICRCGPPLRDDARDALAKAILAGRPRWVAALGAWSQPGLFSWDRLDPGTAMLLASLQPLAGRGADLGCGAGVIAVAALRSSAITDLLLIDIDARAIAASRRTIADPRARFLQLDLRRPDASLDADAGASDFVLTNPPFHHAGDEDRDLGAAFIAAAARRLRPGGRLVMVANVTLPYEHVLGAWRGGARELARGGGFKVLEATR